MVSKYKGATPEQEKLYRQAKWKKFRAMHLKVHNICALCGITERLEVDHITPVSKGGEFWNKNNLWTLCISCHSRKTAVDTGKVRLISVNENGYPLDKEHPWNEEG